MASQPQITSPHIFTFNRKIIEVPNLLSLDNVLFASIINPNPQIKDIVAREGLNFKEVPFGEMPLLIISRYKFYRELKKAITPSSGAYYLLWHEENTEDNRFGFLLQYLPPNAITSKHYHTEQTESFSILEGMLSLETPEGTFSLKAGEQYTVNPNIVHQLQTKETPSLTIIEINKVNYKDHHLVEDSNEKR